MGMHVGWKGFAEAADAQAQAEAEHGRDSWDAGAAGLRTDSEYGRTMEEARQDVTERFGGLFKRGNRS